MTMHESTLARVQLAVSDLVDIANEDGIELVVVARRKDNGLGAIMSPMPAIEVVHLLVLAGMSVQSQEAQREPNRSPVADANGRGVT